MTRGVPNDPAAYAAKRAAISAAKREASPKSTKKRAYVRRTTPSARAQSAMASMDIVMQKNKQTDELRDKISDLEADLYLLKSSNESLRDQLIDVNNRLRALLDLLVIVDLRQN